jgi:hypothetical protein
VAALRAARARKRPQATGGIIPNAYPYPETELTYLGNVLNETTATFTGDTA